MVRSLLMMLSSSRLPVLTYCQQVDIEMDYQDTWRSVRRSLVRYYLICALSVVTGMLLVAVSYLLMGGIAASVVAVLLLAFFILMEQRLSHAAFEFRCPRCHERFWRSKYTNRLWTRPCQHCGLAPWSRS